MSDEGQSYMNHFSSYSAGREATDLKLGFPKTSQWVNTKKPQLLKQ